jgi:hypothetical protein
MDIASIQAINTYISSYVPYVILVIGNIGCICNFITFTSKRLRRNPCGWYFLMSALFDFAFINFGLFTKLAGEQYGSTLQNTNLAWCRIRVYVTWVLPCFSTSYLVLASLDRCLSTSRNPRLRSFSQIKVAHRMTCVPIILYSLTTSHQFFYFVLQPNCVALPGAYSFFLSMYSIVWTSLIPQIVILIFGLITYYNIRKSRRHLAISINQGITQRRNRTDLNMITITLVQVISSSILLNIRTGYYSYGRITAHTPKDNYRLTVEALLLQISNYIFFLNFSKNFFVNTLSSNLFRKVFKQRFIILYRRITCWNVRVQPCRSIHSDRNAEISTTMEENNTVSTTRQ